MMVEVQWQVAGKTTLYDVQDPECAGEIVAELLKSFDLPGNEYHTTEYGETKVLRAAQFHYFPMRCTQCDTVTVHDEETRQWLHADGSPVCQSGTSAAKHSTTEGTQ